MDHPVSNHGFKIPCEYLIACSEQRLQKAEVERTLKKGILTRIDCPHYHGYREGIGTCEANKTRPCLYELGQDCKLYQEILKEWEGE